jgi:hypothetical protein
LNSQILLKGEGMENVFPGFSVFCRLSEAEKWTGCEALVGRLAVAADWMALVMAASGAAGLFAAFLDCA